jgi:thiol:disulfide interchange protein
VSSYQQAKLYLVDNLHLAKDALHIYVALAVFFGACFLFRWKASQWKPLLAVLAVACAGEIWDLHDTLAAALPVDPAGHAKDIANTLLVPAIIVLLARYSRVFRKA